MKSEDTDIKYHSVEVYHPRDIIFSDVIKIPDPHDVVMLKSAHRPVAKALSPGNLSHLLGLRLSFLERLFVLSGILLRSWHRYFFL